jgi:hypothetical protein
MTDNYDPPPRKRGGWRPGAGRPAKDPASRRSPKDKGGNGKPITVYLLPDEHDLIMKAARYMGYTTRSPYVRHALMHYSREVIGD